jgi:hypothetical protein
MQSARERRVLARIADESSVAIEFGHDVPPDTPRLASIFMLSSDRIGPRGDP